MAIGIVNNMNALGFGGAGFCAEYKTIYDAMTVKPSNAVAINQNTFVKSLKSAGIWDKLDMLEVFSLHTNNTGESLLDFKHPTIRSAELLQTAIGVPIFTAFEGFKGTSTAFNSGGGYINTHYNPKTQGVNFTLNLASFGVYCRQYARLAVNGLYAGAQKGLGAPPWQESNSVLGQQASLYLKSTINEAAVVSSYPAVRNGLISLTRTGNTRNIFLNDTLIGQETINPIAVTDADFYIMNSTIPGGVISDFQASMFFAGAYLTPGEISIFFRAFEKYQTSNSKELFYPDSPLWKKKIVAFGDSITQQGSATDGWVWILGDSYQTAITNKGIAGGLLPAILAQSIISNLGEGIEYIFLAGGNDTVFGNLTDTGVNDGFYGALNNAITYFQTTYPTCQLILVSSHDRLEAEERMSNVHDGYVNIADYRNIPICDWYILSGINQSNVNDYTTDGTHLNVAGNALYYQVLKNWLNQNYV
jgi:lysophospholipase L1-like esterase